ncbi:MAG: glycosyl hydrolase 115 family protein [Spirochaetales bacterium]|nr:glycosyl hydrolase 115 family protein [Spirochaetales bacterium]
MIVVSSSSSIYKGKDSYAVTKAIAALQKDIKGIIGNSPTLTEEYQKNQIRIVMENGFEPETFKIETLENENSLLVKASDDLGLVFGIYYVTENLLGVDPFQFWTGKSYKTIDEIIIPSISYSSSPAQPKFRGWFINDEDCLTAWDDSISITNRLWEQIFETILRAGYNMVIPGTGVSPNDPHLDLASEYGLWIAQHHAEPLGAPMFHDIYPDTEARLPEEINKFEKLYKDAVKASRQRKTIWTLGFRGQGDRPFFEDDKRYNTPEKKAALIEKMIDLQKKIVLEMTEGSQFFLHYLYSESGELYRDGYLNLPEDIIHVFCDNGFGAMRVRRNLCKPEPGVPSLPLKKDKEKQLGVYYHVSFHDLEISNKLVPLVAPDIIIDNLKPFTEANDFSFFICNVSNIRPHLFHISLLRNLWDGDKKFDFAKRVKDGINKWVKTYFPEAEVECEKLLMSYFTAPFSFNDKYADCRAGEQVYHHGLRRMIRSLLREEDVRHWFSYIPEHFENNEECFQWLLSRAEGSLPKWEKLYNEGKKVEKLLNKDNVTFFRENLGMHISYMKSSCNGFVFGVKAILACVNREYKNAFGLFYKSRECMLEALNCLLEGETGIWKNFYRGDWLTGTRETIRYIETAISYIRIIGEDLIVNSDWLTDALGLNDTAISIIPQATVSNKLLAEKIWKRKNSEKKTIDLSLLRDTTL